MMSRLRLNRDKPAVRAISRGRVERDQLTFSAFHDYYPQFPVLFEAYTMKHARTKLTVAKLLSRFGQSAPAKRYYRLLRDYGHMRDKGYELALVFPLPDLSSTVDAASQAKESNAIKAVVLHADAYSDEDAVGTRIIWHADDSALPPHVKLDPPLLVLETFSSFYRRIISKHTEKLTRG